jgi:hypothetical protein
MNPRICAPLLLSLALVACAGQMSEPVPTRAPPAPSAASPPDDRLQLTLFYDLLAAGPKARSALGRIESDWDNAYASMLLDLIYFSAAPEIDGVRHGLGTSGFLYRSNKLMYDRATSSRWSTLTGEPVVGPLIGRGIELETLPVVTSTRGEWRRRHPQTHVLSLDTGRERDYSEGAAYQDYSVTDRLMFAVPELDRRLPNKAEVLAMRVDGDALAIATDYLARRPIHHDRLGETDSHRGRARRVRWQAPDNP